MRKSIEGAGGKERGEGRDREKERKKKWKREWKGKEKKMNKEWKRMRRGGKLETVIGEKGKERDRIKGKES